MSLRSLLLLSLLAAAPIAQASEGVFQISQACVADGCFPGDDPGWPVQISEPGSYRLVSNLDRTDLAVALSAQGIDITAQGVVLDLNGFTLRAGVTCSGTPAVCSGTGSSGFGIRSTTRAIIRNGTVQGFNSGVSCFATCLIENILALNNFNTGISTSNDASIIRNSVARGNGTNGFFVVGRVIDNIAEGNGSYGLFMNPRSSASGNVVRDNGGNGVRCFACLLVDNFIASNGGVGVEFGSGSSWHGNVSYDNTGGATSGSALQLGPNRCGNVVCP